jgi:hypothetical protein
VVEHNVADDDQNYRRQMQAHRDRREVDFVPYWYRPSSSKCVYEERDERVYVTLEVASLGTLTISVEPVYNTKLRRLWNQDAVLRAKIE